VEAQCHCGAVRITTPDLPAYLNVCNCSVCTKLGTRWVYFAPDEVEIDAPEGGLSSYVRSDIEPPCLALWRCARCGCVTHWQPIGDTPTDRMGINANLFDPATLDGVEIRPVDGRSWPL